MTNVTAVSFDAKTGNYFAKVGSKTIKSYSKAYVERRVKSMVGDIQVAVAAATEKQNRYGINDRIGFVEKLVTMVATGVQPSAVITGEGGRTASRFKHVVECKSGRGLRRLTPIELERLNMFPDNHTRLGVNGELSDTKRAFFMGNALVVGVVDKIARALWKYHIGAERTYSSK